MPRRICDGIACGNACELGCVLLNLRSVSSPLTTGFLVPGEEILSDELEAAGLVE